MPQVAAERAVVQANETLGEMVRSAAHFKSSVSEAVDENVHRVRRAARRGWHDAQDLIDNAAYKIKRHPFKAVTITAGGAFAVGLLLGWTARGNRRRW